MAAMRVEFGPLVARLKLRRRGRWYIAQTQQMRLVAAVSGVGAARAVETVHRLADEHAPDILIHAGFAGGLQPDLLAGEVIESGWVIDGRGSAISVGDDVPRVLGEKDRPPGTPPLLTYDTLVHSTAQKRALFERHGAVAVDMETFHVAAVAAERRIPLRIVRVISDDAHTGVPTVFSDWITQDAPPAAAAVRYLLHHPTQLPVLWRWWRQSRRAGRALADRIQKLLTDEYRAGESHSDRSNAVKQCFDQAAAN